MSRAKDKQERGDTGSDQSQSLKILMCVSALAAGVFGFVKWSEDRPVKTVTGLSDAYIKLSESTAQDEENPNVDRILGKLEKKIEETLDEMIQRTEEQNRAGGADGRRARRELATFLDSVMEDVSYAGLEPDSQRLIVRAFVVSGYRQDRATENELDRPATPERKPTEVEPDETAKAGGGSSGGEQGTGGSVTISGNAEGVPQAPTPTFLSTRLVDGLVTRDVVTAMAGGDPDRAHEEAVRQALMLFPGARVAPGGEDEDRTSR